MKDKDLLKLLGEIDQDIVDDAAPDPALRVKKKKNSVWKKYIAVAACFVVILSGALVAKPLIDRVNGGLVPNTESEASESNNSVEFENGDNYAEPEKKPSDDEVDAPSHESNGVFESTDFEEDIYLEETFGEATPDYTLMVSISDSDYDSFDIQYSICEPSKVGKKIENVSVEVSCGPDEKVFDAEIYEIAGVNGNLALCMRYIIENEQDTVCGYPVKDAYYVLTSNSFVFGSYDELRREILNDGALFINKYVSYYYKNSVPEYSKRIDISGTNSEDLKLLLSEVIAGEAVELEGSIMPAHVFDESNSIVTLYCTFNGNLGSVYSYVNVYDSGYIRLSAFGGQLFQIGKEAANQIIECVLEFDGHDGYVWNEEEGRWEPLIDNQGRVHYTFSRALSENKLENGGDHIDYSVNYWQNSDVHPTAIYLNYKLLQAMIEVLYSADGYSVKPPDIEKIANESVGFRYIDVSGIHLITVYDNGYVHLIDTYYDVGTEYTNKILYNVKAKGTAFESYYWDRDEECWVSGRKPESDEIESFPWESIDTGRGDYFDILESETETEIDY